jgi:HAD superfamily phosphatase
VNERLPVRCSEVGEQRQMIWINPALSLSKKIDTVVFDVDGVLIDITESFSRAVVETVRYILTHFLGCSNPPAITLDDIEAFRGAGGFNNDWDLSYAAICLLLARPDVPLAQVVKDSRGRGLAWAKNFLPPSVELEYETVRRAFDEFYWGEELFRHHVGHDPQYVRHSGLVRWERSLLPADLIPRLRQRGVQAFGLITGRDATELEFHFESQGWASFVEPQVVITRDRFEKPDPRALSAIAHTLDTKAGIYIGDTMDDLRLVKNFAAASESALFLSLIVSGERGKAHYIEAGADAIVDGVGRLPEFLDRLG